MQPRTGEGAESWLAFVRAPDGSVRSIRHLPADPLDRDLYGRVELATGLLSEFFKIVKTDFHSLGHEVSGYWASAATGNLFMKRAIFLRMESIDGEVNASAVAVDNAAEQFSRLFTACHCGDLDALETARRAGSLPNGSSQCGNTLLHAACSEDQLAVVALLLFMGADTTAKNWAGENPAATARRQGAKASERLLRRVGLSAACTAPGGGSGTAAATLNEKHLQAASCPRQLLQEASQLDWRTGGGAEVEPPVAFAGAAAPKSPQFPSLQQKLSKTLASASVTPENDGDDSIMAAVLTTAEAKNGDANRRKSALPTGTVTLERLASAEAAGSRRPLIRHRRSCRCPRQSKMAGLLALVGNCSDSDDDRIDSESRQQGQTRRLWGGQEPAKQGKLQRLSLPAQTRLRRRKSVTFVGLSPSTSDDDLYVDAYSSDTSDDVSSTDQSDENFVRKCTLQTQKSSRAFAKWLEKKQIEEKMKKLWRCQSSTAPAESAASVARQRHGIFILACSESAGVSSDTTSGAHPLNNASAYRRWIEKREKRSAEINDGSVSHAQPIRYPRRLLTYEEWLSSKSASAVHGEALSSTNESTAMLGQGRCCSASRVTHADWLETLGRRRAAAGEQLRKKAQRDATTASLCDWARTMGSRRKTFAEWCAEKQDVAKRRAAEAQSAAALPLRKCATNSYGRIRPGARTFDSWLLAIEEREFCDRSAALKRERLRLRTVLEPLLRSTASN